MTNTEQAIAEREKAALPYRHERRHDEWCVVGEGVAYGMPNAHMARIWAARLNRAWESGREEVTRV